ncbi:MAG: helix-turn-helix domain-containing protein [Acetobacteraceae bacterium]
MVRTGTDLDGFAALLRPATAQVTVTGRGGPFAGHIVRMALRDLWLQRAVAGSAWINYAAISSGRLGILLGPERGPGAVWQGEPLAATEIAVRNPGQDYCIAVPAGSRWEAMSLPIEMITRAFSVMMGGDPPSPNTSTVRTTPSAMARLRRLRDAADRLAEDAPEVAANAEAARGLEIMLTEAMIDCLAGSGVRDDRAAVRRHETIMRRLRTMLQETDEEGIFLPDLCASMGVSARTLRACCHEYLGMGPQRFLMLRRMHRTRRALQNAHPAATVTEIAMSFGFWELGRFAIEYRRLFGESPSVTLRRARR